MLRYLKESCNFTIFLYNCIIDIPQLDKIKFKMLSLLCSFRINIWCSWIFTLPEVNTIKRRNKISSITIQYSSLAEPNCVSLFYIPFLTALSCLETQQEKNQAIHRCQKLIHSFIKYPIIVFIKLYRKYNIAKKLISLSLSLSVSTYTEIDEYKHYLPINPPFCPMCSYRFLKLVFSHVLVK